MFIQFFQPTLNAMKIHWTEWTVISHEEDNYYVKEYHQLFVETWLDKYKCTGRKEKKSIVIPDECHLNFWEPRPVMRFLPGHAKPHTYGCHQQTTLGVILSHKSILYLNLRYIILYMIQVYITLYTIKSYRNVWLPNGNSTNKLMLV